MLTQQYWVWYLRVVHGVVRDAMRKRRLGDGSTVAPEMLDRVRAAEIGMKFLERKEGLQTEGESEFERQLAAYHSPRIGGATHQTASNAKPGNGSAAPTDPD